MIDPTPLLNMRGRRSIVQQIRTDLDAALHLHKPAPHMCFEGPPGVGKNHLVEAIGKYLDATVLEVKGTAITDTAAMERLFAKLGVAGHDQRGFVIKRDAVRQQIVFIDESEQVPRKLWELLHNVLQPQSDGRRIMQLPSQRFRGRIDDVWVPEFTLMLATNYLGDLRKNGMAALDRCRPNIFSLGLYGCEDLAGILIEACPRLQPEASLNIARRSRGAARLAKAWLDKCSNYAVVNGMTEITDDVVNTVIGELAGVSPDGLNENDLRYLQMLEQASTGKMGLESLAATLHIDRRTLELEIEPWLMHQHLIEIVSGGRVITPAGTERLHQLPGAVPAGRRLAN